MHLPSLFLAAALATNALAQNAPPAVKTEFLTIALDEPVSGLFYRNDQSVQPLDANLTGLGQPLPYAGPQRFDVRNAAAEFTAKQPPPPAASVMLPPKADRVLIAFVKSTGKPLRLVAYDISGAGGKAGDYRFFNFSSKPLSIILDSQRFAVEPGKDRNVSSQSWREGVRDLPMQVAAVENNQPKLVYSSVWGHRPGRRNFIFMFDGRHPSKPIGISRFFDFPPKPEISP
jgi:hypothetical protein